MQLQNPQLLPQTKPSSLPFPAPVCSFKVRTFGGWRCACTAGKGRLTFFVDNRQKVALAKDARQDAYTALACDQCSDLAHHLLGRWHYEMAQVLDILQRAVAACAPEPCLS